MQLILIQDVDHLCEAGELVNVKPGFARNYLLPQGLALSATNRNVKKLAHDTATVQRRVAKQQASANDVASKINVMTLQFERLVGEDDKLFGSVTSKDIAEQLKVAGVEIDHRKLVIAEPIKALGKYEVGVKLHSQITATLKFWVVGKSE